MKKKKLDPSIMIKVFNELFDRQFPHLMGSTKLIKEKGNLNSKKQELRRSLWRLLYVEIGVVLVIISAFVWERQIFPLISLTTGTYGVGILFTITLCYFRESKIVRCKEKMLDSGGYQYFMDAQRMFLLCFDRTNPRYLEAIETDNPNKLRGYLENKARYSVRKLEDVEEHLSIEYLEQSLLTTRVLQTISYLGLMGTAEHFAITYDFRGDPLTTVEKRAKWLREKLSKKLVEV